MNALITTGNNVKMSSREIAEMYDKPHNDVLKKIRKTEEAYVQVFGTEGKFSLSEYVDSTGRALPEILLNKSQALFVASRFDAVLHAKVQKRLEDLEANSRPAIPTHAETLRLYANEIEMKELAIAQRDEAIRTKRHIADKREGTYMATASAATRRANKLEDEIGRGKTWKETKAIPWVSDFFAISKGMWSVLGKKLSALSVDMNKAVRKVESSKYPNGVNAYHVDVIDRMKAKLEADPEMLGNYRKIEEN